MPIDFTLSAEQRRLRDSARRFARDVLSGVRDATRELPTASARFAATRPFYEQAIGAGFLRRLIPRSFGGEGEGYLDMAIVAEEFYAVDVNVSLTLFANLLGLMPLFLAGSPGQHARFVAPFLETVGAPLAAFASSEPGGSANYAAPAPAEGVRTTARRDGEAWVVDGTKQWISSATGWDARGADLLCVVCRTDPDAPPGRGLSVIAVPGPVRGLALLHAPETLGHRAHLVPRFRLDRVRVPLDHVVGAPGQGLALIEASFGATAALVGLMGVGLMRAAFGFALEFARTQRRGGAQPILSHPAVGYAMADAKTAIEASRYLGWKACHAMDAQAPGAMEMALHSKILGSESAVRVITALMSVVGIDSYDHDLPLAGLLQDAMVLPLFDGGNLGVRRRQLHALLAGPDYDPLAAADA